MILFVVSLISLLSAVSGIVSSDTTSSHSCDVSQSKEFKIVCFYDNLGWQRRPDDEKLGADKIDPTLCTHLVYRIIEIIDDGRLNSFYPAIDYEENGGLGELNKFNGLKKLNPNVKTLFTLLDISGGKSIVIIAKSAELRKKFISNILNFAIKFGFDGVDLDLSFVAQFSEDTKETYKRNYVTLVRELQEALKTRCLLLTAKLSNRKSIIDTNYDVPKLTSYLDMFSQDGVFRRWDNLARPFTALKPSPKFDIKGHTLEEANVDWAIDYLLKLGAPANKLVISIETYGYSHKLVNASEHSPWSQTSGQINFKQYFEVCSWLKEDQWKVVRVEGHEMPYAYKGFDWMSYEDADSVAAKVRYARDEKKLAGVGIMDLSYDDHAGKCNMVRFPLTAAISRQVRNSSGLDEAQTRSGSDNKDEPETDEAGLEVLDYLREFGYLPEFFDLDSDRMLTEGLGQFHKFMNIYSKDNEVTSQTAARMKRARCGNKDIYPQSTGADKWLFNNGPKSKQLSYRIVNYPNQLRNRKSEVDSVFEKAFSIWEAVVPIKFERFDATKDAHIDISFHTPEDDQNCPGGALHRTRSVPIVLAHAFGPPARRHLNNSLATLDGDIHFNGQLYWTVDETKIGRVGHSLLAAAIHQIGHSLGLDHSHHPHSKMFPVANNKVQLNRTDIEQVQSLYDPRKRFFEMNNRKMKKEVSEYYGVIVNISSLEECASRAIAYNINATLWNKQTSTCIFKKTSLAEGQYLYAGTGKHLADYDICDYVQDITELEKEAMLWLASGQCDLILQSDDWPVPGRTTYSCKMFEEDSCCILLFRLGADEHPDLTVDKLARLERARLRDLPVS